MLLGGPDVMLGYADDGKLLVVPAEHVLSEVQSDVFEEARKSIDRDFFVYSVEK
jgi:hypothetical protein